MNKLTQEQQQLILDFYFHCGNPKEIEAGRDLVAAVPGAAKLYASLEDALTDLDHIKYEACPDNLVDLTIARLKLMATSSKVSNARLHQLLQQERGASSRSASGSAGASSSSANPIRKNHFLRPLFEVFAAAACIALVAGILLPSLGLARDKSRQVACQMSMGTIAKGFTSFVNDGRHKDEDLATTRVQAGSPWWKIGDQSRQARSNTRYPFMLVKDNYVEGKSFICRGDKKALVLKFEAENIDQFYDFPSYKNISYSFSLFCDKKENPFACGKKIIASDLNPVFQRIRCDRIAYQEADDFLKIELDEQLKNSQSANHQGRGQNLLYGDGSVKYARSRIVNGDDIFTISGVDTYTGREVPVVNTDIFLTP